MLEGDRKKLNKSLKKSEEGIIQSITAYGQRNIYQDVWISVVLKTHIK